MGPHFHSISIATSPASSSDFWNWPHPPGEHGTLERLNPSWSSFPMVAYIYILYIHIIIYDLYDYIWLYMWKYVITSDYIWLYMIIHDYIWLYMIIYDYRLLYIIIYGYRWLYMIIMNSCLEWYINPYPIDRCWCNPCFFLVKDSCLLM